MHGDDPVSLSVGLTEHARVLEADKSKSGCRAARSGRVVLIALLAAVDQDAVLRHLSQERLLGVWTAPVPLPIDEEGQGTVEPSTSVLLGGLPSRCCILQDRVETAVSRHLGY